MYTGVNGLHDNVMEYNSRGTSSTRILCTHMIVCVLLCVTACVSYIFGMYVVSFYDCLLLPPSAPQHLENTQNCVVCVCQHAYSAFYRKGCAGLQIELSSHSASGAPLRQGSLENSSSISLSTSPSPSSSPSGPALSLPSSSSARLTAESCSFSPPELV